MSLKHKPPTRFDINYFISNFFIKNSRLTILVFGLLLIAGIFSLMSLKTTGFPPTEPKIAFVQTIYPGASSEVILEEVTIPLENSLKNVDGVRNFTSQTNANISFITVNIEEDKDLDTVKNKIDTAIKSVSLPQDANTPSLQSLEVTGPDLILSLANGDLEKLYADQTLLNSELDNLDGSSKIEFQNPVKKQLIIKFDPLKLTQAGLTSRDLEANLLSLSETLPVASNLEIDQQNLAITTSIEEINYADLGNLQIFSSNPRSTTPAPKLSEIASIETGYAFENVSPTLVSFKDASGIQTLPSVTINLKLSSQTDQKTYIKELKERIGNNLEYAKLNTGELASIDYNQKLNQKSLIIEAFAVNDDNQQQVSEVLGGMIGSISDLINPDFKDDSETFENPVWYLGFALGGIQLVFLVMIAFVSWRAALISAISIPISILFSTLWVWYRGENLNTLVLFTLVLVIGLVVDPSLVVLEAIQRKFDAGYKRYEAVLEAIKDVGPGVMLAALTNIIAFVPFGIMSGIFGQIFSYIPFTAIPAIIGSYVVPLIFLSWLAGLILKPSKNSKGHEEDNLWAVSKWLIALNTKILNGSRLLRILIIVLGLIIPIGLSVVLFQTGLVKQVSFTQSTDSESVILSADYLGSIPRNQKDQTTQAILNYINSYPEVQGIVNSSLSVGGGSEQNIGYQIILKERSEREKTAFELAKEWQDKLNQEYLNKSLFDLQINALSNAGPQSSYQVQFLVESNNPETLKTSSVEIAKFVSQSLCLENSQAVIKPDCDKDNLATQAYDDGYTNKQTILYDLVFKREAILENNLAALGQGPLLGSLNGLIKEQVGQTSNQNQINLDGENLDLIIESQSPKISTLQEAQSQLQNTSQIITGGNSLVPKIEQIEPKASILRVEGKTVSLINIRLKDELKDNQGFAAGAVSAITEYYSKDDSKEAIALGLEKNSVISNDTGAGADTIKAFSELGIALVLAIFISYILLAVFFNSLTQPLAILYTIPLALLGAFPGLAIFVGGQFGFLEVIGLIILVGIVENVAIFLLDLANQKVLDDGWDYKKAISFAAGVRFRPVFLTSLTAVVSLAPLAFTSDFYRSISIVIMFGIASSGLISLVTTPILYVFFRWLSDKFAAKKGWAKFWFWVLAPITVSIEAYKDYKANKPKAE